MINSLALSANLSFRDLGLEREPITRRLPFTPAPLAALCRFNGLDPTLILADEDLACWLITEWYCAHHQAGGEPDMVAEQILTEIAAENASGIAILQHGSGLAN